jgi:hypothetical protein
MVIRIQKALGFAYHCTSSKRLDLLDRPWSPFLERHAVDSFVHVDGVFSSNDVLDSRSAGLFRRSLAGLAFARHFQGLCQGSQLWGSQCRTCARAGRGVDDIDGDLECVCVVEMGGWKDGRIDLLVDVEQENKKEDGERERDTCSCLVLKSSTTISSASYSTVCFEGYSRCRGFA